MTQNECLGPIDIDVEYPDEVEREFDRISDEVWDLIQFTPIDVLVDEGNSVYMIEDRANDAVKIGMSRDTQNRLTQLQSSTVNELRVVSVIANAGRFVEKELHNIIKDHRIRGEWFDADFGWYAIDHAAGAWFDFVSAVTDYRL